MDKLESPTRLYRCVYKLYPSRANAQAITLLLIYLSNYLEGRNLYLSVKILDYLLVRYKERSIINTTY